MCMALLNTIIMVLAIFFVLRKLQEAELENLILRDPNSRANRLHRLGMSSHTMGTSGHFVQRGTSASLLARITIIRDEDFTSGCQHIGSGRFGTCYLRTLCHYQVCVKQFKSTDSSNDILIHEANILSKFTHINLPYLFGVCLGTHPSIVTSFHGFGNTAVTIHSALYSKSEEVQGIVASVSWMDILQQMCAGLEHLHCYHSVIHNDLKCDNVVLASTSQACVKAVIIDFGKACSLTEGKKYTLNYKQREHYKINHPHVAPDVRDGLYKQSDASDVYSFGRMINVINSVSLDNKVLKELSLRCMQYQSQVRPNIKSIRQMLIQD